ncbi:hypothetical protein [Acinetobacter sp. MD2(2019)]|uniref:hypothetical protein n=1 Tax=Acinetobacter sp. MD2(2019) TaxID=2605273 RepID=UPI002D1E5557|nr:hypothetical protein [Acinetobacter sp. MD2(2019)]
MRHLSIVVGLSVGLIATTAAFAESAVQPGETLESLSQAKVSTTVNGQPGSLKDLINSGKYTPVTPETTTSDPAAKPNDAPAPPVAYQPAPATDTPPPATP